MALNFPSSPTIGQVYTDSISGFSYEWDGNVWKSYSPSSSSQIKILDDISASFNGSTQIFALTSGGFVITPASPQSLIINLGGVIQDPTDDYSVSGSNITFSTAPVNGLSFSGVSLGPAVPINTVTDGTVTPAKLSTGGPSWNASGDLSVSGDISGSGSGLTGVSTNFVSAIGIQSAGLNIGVGITQLNFIGAGNTFAVNGTTVDISISGSGGGAGLSTSGISTGYIWSNPNSINESIDLTQPDHNYAMIGPISVAVGATVTVGAGNTFTII
jgi:hypothetical protein